LVNSDLESLQALQQMESFIIPKTFCHEKDLFVSDPCHLDGGWSRTDTIGHRM
jgi:hypothetical protein